MPNSIRNKLDSFLCPNERNEQKTAANSSLNIFVCIKGDIKHLLMCVNRDLLYLQFLTHTNANPKRLKCVYPRFQVFYRIFVKIRRNQILLGAF